MSGRGMRAAIAEIVAEARADRARIMTCAVRRDDGVMVCPALYAEGYEAWYPRAKARMDGRVPRCGSGAK